MNETKIFAFDTMQFNKFDQFHSNFTLLHSQNHLTLNFQKATTKNMKYPMLQIMKEFFNNSLN